MLSAGGGVLPGGGVGGRTYKGGRPPRSLVSSIGGELLLLPGLVLYLLWGLALARAAVL